jgi:hypothetical protein
MSGRFDTRLLAFMSDFTGEGTDNALANIKDSGVAGVTVALAYHTARDVFPHNPSGEVIYQEGGTVYFQPDLDRYSALKPVEAELTRGTRLSATVTDRARELDLRIGAWLVVLHNTRLATLHQECAQETAAGDRLTHALCPSNPDVRAYALALIEDIATRGFDHLLVEALTFMPFDHGYHHERALIELDPRTRFLLGLCFCPHCLSAGDAAGSDAARLRRWVRAEVRRVLDRGEALTSFPPDREWAWSGCDGELGRYLAARTDTVSGLAAAAARTALAAGAGEVSFVDPSGAMLGYDTGRPDTTEHAVDIGWQVGVSCERIGGVMDVAVTAYFADPVRLRSELEAYLDTVPPGSGVHVILRPMPPDSRSGPELIARMRVLPSQGVRVVSFYHYGLMRLESLEWIEKALEATEEGDR